MKKDLFSSILFSTIGCLSCYFLRDQFFLTPVLSSAIVGLLGSYIWHSEFYNFKIARACVYTGSFIAMSSSDVTSSYLSYVFISILAGLFFVFSQNLGAGFGGKLGSIAFASVILFSALKLAI